MELLVQGIHDKLMNLPDDFEVHPGHGPATTIGAEGHWLEWTRANRALPR